LQKKNAALLEEIKHLEAKKSKDQSTIVNIREALICRNSEFKHMEQRIQNTNKRFFDYVEWAEGLCVKN